MCALWERGASRFRRFLGRFLRATPPLRLPHLPLRLLCSQEHRNLYMFWIRDWRSDLGASHSLEFYLTDFIKKYFVILLDCWQQWVSIQISVHIWAIRVPRYVILCFVDIFDMPFHVSFRPKALITLRTFNLFMYQLVLFHLMLIDERKTLSTIIAYTWRTLHVDNFIQLRVITRVIFLFSPSNWDWKIASKVCFMGGSEVNPNTLLSSAEPKRLNRSLISF